MKESTTYQAILQEGWEVGREVGWEVGRREGQEEGREAGREAGRAEEAQALISRLGRKRLGAAASEVETALRSIADLQRLERIADRILEVESWNDLLATE